MNERKLLPTTRAHPSRSHEVGSQKFPTLALIVQHELLEHGEDKNAIDGLNNKLIKILQEDDSYVMNEAKVLFRPKA
jgi:iron-sulfur cluster repair protein YtfE (RIC family)